MLASGAGMDASVALSELVGVSTQVVEAVITGPEGAVEAARTAGDERARGRSPTTVPSSSRRRRDPGGRAGRRAGARRLDRGSLVAVSDGERTVVATTVAEPTVGLVAYDLRTVLARVRGDGQ